MSLFDVLSKGFCSKKRESNEILSQEEYKDKFLHGDEYIKRELYDEYISRRLSEEFGLKYNEKIKKWHSEWSVICTLFTGQPVRRVFLCVIVMSLK